MTRLLLSVVLQSPRGRTGRRDPDTGRNFFTGHLEINVGRADWVPVPSPRLENSLSQGVEWKTLISAYMTAMPFNGVPCCVAEHSTSGGPVSRTSVRPARTANVGAAAKAIQSETPSMTVWQLARQVLLLLDLKPQSSLTVLSS
ncbi:MAG: hypothetical protein AB7O43_18070 [Hyphomicrobiaceae bacterium]